MTHLWAGAAAGFLATLPMTAAMSALHQQLPQDEQYPLPPREITMELAEEAGVAPQMAEPERLRATLAAHFGYGAMCGAIYGQVSGEGLAQNPLLKGVGYGLAVWGISYLGLLPAVGLLAPATKHPPRRTALMIAAHVIWGGCTGVLAVALSTPRRQPPGWNEAGNPAACERPHAHHH